MKKLFFITLLSVAGLFNTANAQEVKFGIKAGVNLANISGANISSDNKTGFHAGIILEVSLLKTFAIQPELLYSTQGAKTDDGADLTLNYISLPVLAKYYLVPGVFSIEGGPQFSFLIEDKFDIDGLAEASTDASNFDLGAAIGLGIKIPGGLFGQVRYVRGITTVAESPDINNNLFQVSLGYRF